LFDLDELDLIDALFVVNRIDNGLGAVRQDVVGVISRELGASTAGSDVKLLAELRNAGQGNSERFTSNSCEMKVKAKQDSRGKLSS